MPKKYVVFFKSIGRKWFIFLILAIAIVAFVGYYRYNTLEPAIVITVISLILFVLSYIPNLYFNRKLLKLMKKYYRIEDKTVAQLMDRSLYKVKEIMFDFSKKQVKKKKWQFWWKNKKWLIAYLTTTNQYIYYHEQTVERFKELYNKGYGDKEILGNLKDYELSSNSEIKIIIDTLINYKKISDREISVKERRKEERFKNI